jgi:competence protein ComER
MLQFGFIGTGSMGSMLVKKFVERGMIEPAAIYINSKNGLSSEKLAKTTQVIASPSNRMVAEEADILFICVKPLQVRDVLKEIQASLKTEALLVSIAGCVSLAQLENWTLGKVHCVRVIPSVTSEQNVGISLVTWGHNLEAEDKEKVLKLFNAISRVVEVDEANLETCTNLTSCGPALISAMMKEFVDAAVRTGTIKPSLAEYLVKETMIGAAALLEKGSLDFEEVIERVTTKGGSTEEGVKVFHAQLPSVCDEALRSIMAKRLKVSDEVSKML